MTTGTPLAYQVGQFRDPQEEIARLAQQAAIIAMAEEQALLALGMPQQGRLLDVGCGPGFVARRLRQTRPDLETMGVDRDPAVLSLARAHMKVLAAAADQLPFSEGHFDVVHTRLVLRHLVDPDAAMREAHRVLRPGGLAIAVDSDDGALLLHPEPAGFFRALAARQETFRRRGADPFMGRRLPGLFRDVGFTAVALRTLTVDSLTLGRHAFARIVLSPIAEAIDPDLLSKGELDQVVTSIDLWVADPNAFGMTTALAVGGRKGD